MDKYKKDKYDMIMAIITDPIEYVLSTNIFKDDREVALTAVKHNVFMYNDLSDEYNDDKDFVLVAVRNFTPVYLDIPIKFKQDLDVALALLDNDEYASYLLDSSIRPAAMIRRAIDKTKSKYYESLAYDASTEDGYNKKHN